MAAAALPGSKISQAQHDEVGALVKRLIDPQKREIVLQQLSKKRETFPYLAPMLWHSVGTIAVLLQEIIAIYPALSPPTLDNAASSRVCNALALLQCVAGHPETRKEFLKGLSIETPAYQHHTKHLLVCSANPFISVSVPEYKELSQALRVLEAHQPWCDRCSGQGQQCCAARLAPQHLNSFSLQQDDPQVVEFLLSTEIIPLSLRIMEVGTDLSRTVGSLASPRLLPVWKPCSTVRRLRPSLFKRSCKMIMVCSTSVPPLTALLRVRAPPA